MNRILATALVLLLVAITWSPTSSQTSDRITLQFSDEESDSLSEGKGLTIDLGTDESPKVRTRSGDIVRFGEDIIVDAGERIHGDVIAVGGTVRVRGIVDGDVAAIGGDVHIEQDGDVRGEAISVGGQVTEHGRGRVTGSSVSMPHFPYPLLAIPSMHIAKGFGNLLADLLGLGLLLLLAWALAKMAPDRAQLAADYVRGRPGPSFLWGVLAIIGLAPSVIAVALVAVILCITIIGIPVAVLLLIGYFVGLVVLLVAGYLVGASVVGRWLALRFRPQDGTPTLMRSLVYGVIALELPDLLQSVLQASWLLSPVASGLGEVIEVIGTVIIFFVAIFGVGAVLGSKGGQPQPLYAAGAAAPAPGASPIPGPISSSPEAQPGAGPPPAAPPADPGSPEGGGISPQQ